MKNERLSNKMYKLSERPVVLAFEKYLGDSFNYSFAVFIRFQGTQILTNYITDLPKILKGNKQVAIQQSVLQQQHSLCDDIEN